MHIVDSQERDPGERPSRRRKALLWISVMFGGIAAAVVAIPVIGFIVAPAARRSAARWRRAGRVIDFAVGSTTKVILDAPDEQRWAGAPGPQAVYLRRPSEERFFALSVYCTHTGCPVRWVEGAKLFLCPCHGGAFHQDGEVAAGPPPYPLPRHETRVRDGLVEIRTTPALLRRRT